ncbi:SDR family oxidoreductase [Massilia endophytica]|uniref:SDR family oxidoreductase n=1 Tax=Massilia endophytica TaxID=2899220 RepID=UPI001E34108D|nr:SDR family NAD(P)-dependent oxidoreductase [Massilia endophytica]UGQ48154.1 SDR family oxidoreductase [Massilia endophytica]
MNANLKRTAVVTGAAQGIGKAIAARLLQEGHRVGLIDIDGPALEASCAELGAGGQCIGVQADVGSPPALKSAILSAADRLGAPHILVNNAGFARDGALESMKLDDWDSIHHVHLRAAFLAAQTVLPFMESAGWGRIINISSISGGGHADRANYCAAKAGLDGLTRALALELGPRGITVNAVAPGMIVTRMTSATANRLGRTLDDHIARAADNIPVRRTGRPEDVAHAMAFFASEAAGFVSGQVLYVAGGPV